MLCLRFSAFGSYFRFLFTLTFSIFLLLLLLLLQGIFSFSLFRFRVFGSVFPRHYFQISSWFCVSIGIIETTHVSKGPVWTTTNSSIFRMLTEDIRPVATRGDPIINYQLHYYFDCIILPVGYVFSTPLLPFSIPINPLTHAWFICTIMPYNPSRASIISMVLGSPTHSLT